jgi:hypothetical protein
LLSWRADAEQFLAAHLPQPGAERFQVQLVYASKVVHYELPPSKGFSTPGQIALELETVYVDLSVDPAAVGSIPQDPIGKVRQHDAAFHVA